ncbi:hypothetical protein CCS41_06230 [Candidatus Fukatsuia symbiotica]|uniref:Uncharacterized protein n=2 Tax=Yersiniaceae TaxID=1903411 RepID=A0A2U8I4T3_9GAMM|nr:hypothetical protein CCS41_06230 [Candidatus Fukatsuia symbiotica]
MGDNGMGGGMKHVKDLLAAWGNWSSSRIGTEFKACWPLCQQEGDSRPWLSDEEGKIVDQAVGV